MGLEDDADAEHFLQRLADAYVGGPVVLVGSPGYSRGSVLADLVRMAPAEPGRARAIVRRLLLRRLVDVETLVDRVPDGGLAAFAAGAVDALRDGADIWDSPAVWTVARVAQQDPEAVGPFRERLVQLVRADPPAAPWWLWPPEWAWRGAPDGDLDVLVDLLDDPDLGLRTVAWSCLVASRTATGLTLAEEARGVAVPDDEDAETRLLMAAQDPDVRGRSLAALPSVHLVDLPKGYVELGARQLPAAPGVDAGLPPIVTTGRLGGFVADTCPTCGAELLRLVEVDALPEAPDLPVVLTCTACLGQADEVVYVDVADDGPPITLPAAEGDPGPIIDLPPTTVVLRAAPPRSELPSIEDTSTQVLTRIGGEPAWIGAPEYPACPRCDLRMPFLLQLDSLPLRHAPRVTWGVAGYLWAFWCEPCQVVATYVPIDDSWATGGDGPYV